MSTTFTADATSGVSPASVPDPTTVPILTLPADGDADNAASVAQAFEATANEAAWLKTPRAKASSWAQPIRQYKNARLQVRDYIDHMGHLMYQGIYWDQNWNSHLPLSAWPTSGEPWIATLAGGTVASRAPTTSSPASPLFPNLVISPATSTNLTSSIRNIGTCVPTDNLGAALKWTAALDAVGTNRTTVLMGLIDATAAAGGTQTVPNWGAWFSKANGDVNWQCNVSGVSPVDSTVAPVAGTFKDFRIDILGANVSDDSAGRVIFYVDSAIVANIPVTVSALPTNADALTACFAAFNSTIGGAAVTLYVGPAKYRQNTYVNQL